MKNKIMQRLFFIFLFFNFADLFTSYFILDGEANPIYLWLGSIWPLYILKIAISIGAYLIIKKNEYETNFTLYMMIVFMLYGTIILSFGVYNNLQGMNNPEILEAAKQIPVEVKIKAYSNFITLLYFIPASITLLAFKVYEWAVKNTNLKCVKGCDEE